jgi:hypothetical protein
MEREKYYQWLIRAVHIYASNAVGCLVGCRPSILQSKWMRHTCSGLVGSCCCVYPFSAAGGRSWRPSSESHDQPRARGVCQYILQGMQRDAATNSQPVAGAATNSQMYDESMHSQCIHFACICCYTSDLPPSIFQLEQDRWAKVQALDSNAGAIYRTAPWNRGNMCAFQSPVAYSTNHVLVLLTDGICLLGDDVMIETSYKYLRTMGCIIDNELKTLQMACVFKARSP